MRNEIKFGGPMFEHAETTKFKSCFAKEGAHYNIFEMVGGIEALFEMFPDGKANEFNLVLFSTSGIHGTYNTIEEVESELRYPSGDGSINLTVLIVHPRLVCMRFGCFDVKKDDIPFLKTLRKSSWDAMLKIGRSGGKN